MVKDSEWDWNQRHFYYNRLCEKWKYWDCGIALPKGPATDIAEKLVECGVKAFWNFAHTDLGFSDDIIVENVHLSESLMKLTYRISEKANKNK